MQLRGSKLPPSRHFTAPQLWKSARAISRYHVVVGKLGVSLLVELTIPSARLVGVPDESKESQEVGFVKF